MSIVQFYLALALAALVGMGGTYVWGRHDGKTINEAAWQKREAELNAASAKAIEQRAEQVRTEERVKADKQNEIAINLHEQLKANADAKDHTIAELRAGTRRLSILAQCPTAADNGVSKPGAGRAGNPGSVRVELPDGTARDLVALASRCDRITDTLRAAQQIILNDRKGQP